MSKSRKLKSSELLLGIGRGAQLGRQAVCGSEAQHSGLVGEKDSDARDEQSVGQAVDDGFEQGAEIGFGTESAAEFDESFAVVIALAVEGAIHPTLNTAFEGIEDGRGDENRDNQRPLAHRLRQTLVNELGDDGDDAEVAAQNQAGGKRVSDAALEDQVGVHQAIAHDGPGEREWQKDQRQAGELVERAGHVNVEQEGYGVEQREWHDRKECAAPEPLELLAL